MAFELLLLAVKEVFKAPWLPLGGGHLQQVAVLFIVCFVVLELFEACRPLFEREKK